MKKINKHWKTIKITMINWTIVVFLVMAYTIYVGYTTNQALQGNLQTCKADWERLGKKIENGEVVVKTDQTLNINRQGMEVKK